jgi:hypothetical protein
MFPLPRVMEPEVCAPMAPGLESIRMKYNQGPFRNSSFSKIYINIQMPKQGKCLKTHGAMNRQIFSETASRHR